MSVLLLVLGIVLFIGLIIIHEFGHFIAARRNGVEVEEFGIFFPPTLYRRKTKAGWDFTINALPLGGFVKLKGENDTDTTPGSFGAASTWVKTKIMTAGVVFNLLTALVMLTVLAFIGIPKLIPNQFTVKQDTQIVSSAILIRYVEPGSPADKAGLEAQDQILNIAQPGYSPVSVSSTEALPKITQNFAGKDVKIFYVRDGEHRVAKTKLLSKETVEASRKTNNPKGYLGIAPVEYTVQRSTWSAPVVAVGLTGQLTELSFKAIGGAFEGLGSAVAGFFSGNPEARKNGQTKASEQASGPVGIFATLQKGTSLGLIFILFVVALISLSLAIMNIMPIPALDGGRLWMMLISRAVRRPISAQLESAINLVGFAFLLLLIVLITIVDFKRFY